MPFLRGKQCPACSTRMTLGVYKNDTMKMVWYCCECGQQSDYETNRDTMERIVKFDDQHYLYSRSKGNHNRSARRVLFKL